MADDAPTPKAPDGWVRGGSTTSAYDKELQRRKAEADARRAIQDQQFAVAQANPDEARMRSMNLGGRDTHAMVVLGVRHPKDKQILYWITCELITQPDSSGGIELVLNMACVWCAQRNPQECNFRVAQSNRKFWLDTKRAGELWVNPLDVNEVITLAGTITTEGALPCPGLGCPYKYRIDDSVVYVERK